jgi:channel protein (hemolysin III family)
VANIQVYPWLGLGDPVSGFTHLLGAVVFLWPAVLLLHRGRGDWRRVALLSVFVLSALFLLVSSGTYHLLPLDSSARAVFWRLDVAGIFVLIAGTFTPVHGLLFRGPMRWAPLLFIWAMAAVGMFLTIAFLGRVPHWAFTACFLGMGWTGLIGGIVLWRRDGFAFVRPLLLGAAAYTLGAVLEVMHWPTILPGVVGPHEVWHVAVLAGIFFHWQFTYQFAAGETSAMVVM